MGRQDIPDGLIILTFDDGNRSDVELVAPLLKRLGFGATFFVTEGLDFLRDKGQCMTWQEVRSLHELGFEIGNHTRTHADARKQSRADFAAELDYMAARFEEEGIPVPRTFCYPAYHFDRDAVEVLAENGYAFARRGLAPEFPSQAGCGRAYDPTEDHPLLVPTAFASGPNCMLDDFTRAVKEARDGRIAVLTFHGVPDAHPWVSTSPAAFRSCMQHLRDSGCTVIAMRDLARYVEPDASGDPMAPIEGRLTVQPFDLKCEYAVNPLGIDVARPRFSWLLESCRRGQKQTAYRILVAGSRALLDGDNADKWDSGRAESDRSVNVPYDGFPLASGEKCWWKVRCWDADGNPGDWSEPATFEMALLEPADWHAEWVSTAGALSSPLFRKSFTCPGSVRRARLYVSGLGYYEARVNGRRVGDHVLDPGTTYYHNGRPEELRSRVLYVTHDVTDLLQSGQNTIGVMLGHGWYSADGEPPGRTPYGDRPVLILQMNVEFEDGQTMSVVSDESWRTSPGPITANDFANGEHYDARLEQPGWDEPGFDDSGWERAARAEGPNGMLTAQALPPIRVVQTLKPTRVLQSNTGSYIFDMGQHFSGWARLRVEGPRGTKVTLRCAGRVNYDVPALDRRNSMWFSRAEQADSYTLKGEGVEVWEPRFTLHGFRYVEVIGCPGTPSLDDVEGRVVRSSVDRVGDFECANDLVNRVHHNACRTFAASMQSIPQDAAERAERVGWLGDTGFVIEDYLYNFDGAAFWAKWMRDISDAQMPDGAVPHVCPVHCNGGYSYWPTWQGTYPIIVWRLFQYYDDRQILEDHYEGIRKLIAYFGAGTEDLIVPGDQWGKSPLGDHMEPQPDRTSEHFPRRTPPSLCSTAYYYFSTWLLSRMAEELGRAGDAAEYAALAQRIKDAYNRAFLDEETNRYATGSQTCNALSLYVGLVPADRQRAVLDNLTRDILEKHGGHLSTGILGTDALEQALPACGRADVMWTIATQTTFPSWGYMVENGATSIWEDWEGSDRRSVSMKMLASCEKFFYKDVAGIAPATPGFGRIAFKPDCVESLDWARAALRTVRGQAEVAWERCGGAVRMQVRVPANVTADVFVPRAGLEDVTVTESGSPAWEAGAMQPDVPGIVAAEEEERHIRFSVGSGCYEFRLSGRAPDATKG